MAREILAGCNLRFWQSSYGCLNATCMRQWNYVEVKEMMILTMLTNDVDVVAGLRMDVKRSGFCLRRFWAFWGWAIRPLEPHSSIRHRIVIGWRPSFFKSDLFALDFQKVQKKSVAKITRISFMAPSIHNKSLVVRYLLHLEDASDFSALKRSKRHHSMVI